MMVVAGCSGGGDYDDKNRERRKREGETVTIDVADTVGRLIAEFSSFPINLSTELPSRRLGRGAG